MVTRFGEAMECNVGGLHNRSFGFLINCVFTLPTIFRHSRANVGSTAQPHVATSAFPAAPHYYDLICTICFADNLHEVSIVNAIYPPTPDVLLIRN